MVWIAFAPLGPVGDWKGGPYATLRGNTDTLKTFDPFFRMSAQTGAAIVTSLPLRLFGVRVDEATGHGSAIIQTPDGIQQSFAVNDEVMPGVRLKTVARDNVTIDRGGTTEQLFLDQSTPATVAQPGVGAANGSLATPQAAMAAQTNMSAAPGMTPPVTSATPPVSASPTPNAIQSGIAFAPRMVKGAVTGFTVAPKGAGETFRAAGFLPGDVVTQINGADINSVQSAATAIAKLPPGAQMKFTVERAGKSVTLTAKADQ